MSVSRRALTMSGRRFRGPPSLFVRDRNNFVKQGSIFRTAKQTQALLKYCFWVLCDEDFAHDLIERQPSCPGLCAVCLFDLWRKGNCNSPERINLKVVLPL